MDQSHLPHQPSHHPFEMTYQTNDICSFMTCFIYNSFQHPKCQDLMCPLTCVLNKNNEPIDRVEQSIEKPCEQKNEDGSNTYPM